MNVDKQIKSAWWLSRNACRRAAATGPRSAPHLHPSESIGGSISLVLLCVGLLLTGCQSPAGGGNGFAAVKISGHTPKEILTATVAVFRADGYRDIAPSPDAMVFEKQGTGMNQAAYGGWTDAKPVTVRVRAGVETLPAGGHRLWCQAYMVGDAGNPLFEEEHKLTSMRAGSYQKLLDEVAERLK